MSTRNKSWQRLQGEVWCNNPSLAQTNDSTAKFQRISKGVGPLKRDEYSIIIDTFPKDLSPLNYLKKFAFNPNKVVNSCTFHAANKFTKRVPGRLRLGDIWDIDIFGPDNGSIILVALADEFGKEGTSSWFDIHTIECEKYGTHPECGAREFGFEMELDKIKFYTRGVSRAYSTVHRTGTPIQRTSWRAMLEGVLSYLESRGAIIKNKHVYETLSG